MAELPTQPQVLRALPLAIAALVGVQLVVSVALNLAQDGPVGWLETDGGWLNQLIPAFTLSLWLPLEGVDLTGWGGVVATFLAFPVGVWAAVLLRRRPRRTWWIWATLAVSVAVTVTFQSLGTLWALRVIG